MGQFEELTQKILLHLPEKLHIDRRFPATKGAQKADRHEIAKIMARCVTPSGVFHIIEIAGQCWHLETPPSDETSRIQF